MATEVGNTLEPSDVSGSGLYRRRLYGGDLYSTVDDAASIKAVYGDKASESLNYNYDKGDEILRLSIQGFNFSGSGLICWEDVVIYRAGHRKVEIQLLDTKYNPSDREKRRSLVIDLDHVVFVPKYISYQNTDLECIFREHGNASIYLLKFKTLQDVSKFQEVFAGFSVQTHMSDVRVRLRALDRKRSRVPWAYRTTIQLWRKIPNQYESFNGTTDAPYNQPHAWIAEEGRARPEYEGSSTKFAPTTASNIGSNLSDGSAMEPSASSLLVFGAKKFVDLLFGIPLDGRISIKGQCSCKQSEGWCNHFTLGEDNANTRSQQTPSFEDIPATRSGAIAWGAVAPNITMSSATGSSATRPGALGSSIMASSAAVSRSSNVTGIIMQNLPWVQLEFETIEDKNVFEAAFDALNRQHGPHLREEKLHPNYQFLKEQGSLTRKYESAAVDAENTIPTVVQKGDNTEITPFYKAKAEEGNSLAPLPHSPPALAGDSNSRIGERPDNLAFAGGRLNPKIELDNRKRSSNDSDDRQQESIRPANEGESRQRSLFYSAFDDYLRLEEDSRITSRILATQSHLPEYSPPKNLEFPAAAAESLRASERSDISEPHALGALAYDCNSLELVLIDVAIKDVDPNLRLLDRSPRSKSLQCPFHFLGCNKEFHIHRKQGWIKHSLTHFQKADRYADLIKRVEPPKSFHCYFCKTKFSRVSGTVCWTDYMHHIHRCGIGYERVPPHSTLIEYLWQKEIISVRTYQGFQDDHPPFPIWKHNLARVSALSDSEPSATFVSETSGDEKQGSRSETQANTKIERASLETSAKREQWRRRICRKIVIFMLWKREQDVCIPDELWSSPASFEFINVLEMPTFDKIKGLFETYSGREWNWWPFSAPAKPLDMGKVRIRWQCACGDQRWTDASRCLARKCQALINENTTAGHERGDATSQSTGAASHSQSGSVVPGSFPSDTSQSIEDTSNTCSEAQASHNQTTYKDSNSKDLYVLFCIYQQSQILHSQIVATKCQNDEAFFESLRQEYRRLRGFFRFWFSPFQFSHCDFVKFTRFYVNELAKVGHSLPIDLIYQYNPRPPGPHEDPPISPHEFRRRFYTHFTNPCGRDEALVRIPKRQKRFQINLHVDGREDMWGLHVELQPCFLVVLMWQIAITGGGCAFMGWWLSRHQGDLQNAAMPITLIVTAMMALWAPIGKGMRETL